MRTVRAISLLLVYFLIALHGCPGLDYLGERDFVSERSKRELRSQMPEWGAQIAFAFGDFNRGYRLPLVRATEKLQKPFRVAQTWNLYRDGPGRVNRLEIRVDDVLVFRTGDDSYDWLEPQLRNRRLRPVVESTTRKLRSKNWRGLTRFLVEHVHDEFPDAQKLELTSYKGAYPKGKMHPRHRIVAESPNWTPTLHELRETKP